MILSLDAAAVRSPRSLHRFQQILHLSSEACSCAKASLLPLTSIKGLADLALAFDIEPDLLIILVLERQFVEQSFLQILHEFGSQRLVQRQSVVLFEVIVFVPAIGLQAEGVVVVVDYLEAVGEFVDSESGEAGV